MSVMINILLALCLLFQAPIRDPHRHEWDDARILLVKITELKDRSFRWIYESERGIKYGEWIIGAQMRGDTKQMKKLKRGNKYIVIYCSACDTAIATFDGK